MLFGVTLNLLDVNLPFNLGKSLEWLGMAAIPIALLILGMQLANSKFFFGWQEIGGALAKLAIAPLVAYGVGKIINLEIIDLQVLILQTAMPTAVNSLIMVTEFGGNAILVARTIIISTIISFISLPIVIWLISQKLIIDN
jgi:predicted permease